MRRMSTSCSGEGISQIPRGTTMLIVRVLDYTSDRIDVQPAMEDQG